MPVKHPEDGCFYTVFSVKKASVQNCPVKCSLSWIASYINVVELKPDLCIVVLWYHWEPSSNYFSLSWGGKGTELDSLFIYFNRFNFFLFFLKADESLWGQVVFCFVLFFNTIKRIFNPYQQKTEYVYSGGLACENICWCMCVKCWTVQVYSVGYNINT